MSINPPIINVACQYAFNSSSNLSTGNKLNLPQAWSSLPDAFLLHEGEYLLSKNQLYQLSLKNGNLLIIQVLFKFLNLKKSNPINLFFYFSKKKNYTNIIWQTNTFYSSSFIGAYNLAMQSNGNLILEDDYGNIIWQSNTIINGQDRYKLELGDAGSISIFNSNNEAIWTFPQLISNTTGIYLIY